VRLVRTKGALHLGVCRASTRQQLQHRLVTRGSTVDEEIMRIFTSWSGERSKAAALGLRSLLQDLFEDAVDVFISEHINPGEAWAVRLGRELEESEFGIICITQENAHAPWLLFEAGAIAKK